MPDSDQPFHGQGGNPIPDSGPSLAQRARTLMCAGGHSTLSTLSKKHPGFPFGSVMPYVVDARGRPLFLISSMAMHTKNLDADPRATLLVTQIAKQGAPLGAARVSVMGEVVAIPESDRDEALSHYVEVHPQARQWASFGDFQLYRMQVLDVYFVGGFGVMGWITAADYSSAEPDPLARSAANIISHMNDEHVDAMLLLADKLAGLEATQAEMLNVDQHGFDLKLQTAAGPKRTRIHFPRHVSTSAEVRDALVAMVTAARAESKD